MTPASQGPSRDLGLPSHLLDLDPSETQEQLQSLDQVVDHVSGGLQEESCASS